jgi:hypothetical protein
VLNRPIDPFVQEPFPDERATSKKSQKSDELAQRMCSAQLAQKAEMRPDYLFFVQLFKMLLELLCESNLALQTARLYGCCASRSSAMVRMSVGEKLVSVRLQSTSTNVGSTLLSMGAGD